MRKVLWAILVAVCLIDAGLYWQSRRVHKQLEEVDNTLSVLEQLSRDIDALNKELDRAIAEADDMIGHLRHLPPPTNGVKTSYHDGGYESAWVQDIDKKDGIVLVTTIDSKMTIVFKPTADNLDKFHVGWIAPVTFQCTKVKKGKCDFNSPYKLFAGNGLVEVKRLELPKK